MSFGYSISDAVLLTQLAWKTVQNARKACGEHDELTREVLSLQVVLRRLEQEVEKPGNPIHEKKSGETYKQELKVIVDGCRKVLSVLDQVLTKYNALSEQERSGRKLWQKIRFGNGTMGDLAEQRGKLTYYTSALSLFLNMVSMGTMGRVERQMTDAGGELKEIKVAVHGITAHLMSRSNRHEGSILTAYADDDRAVWKEFRRELVEDGFSSSVIRKHKRLIKAYIEELGSRGLLDEEDPNDNAEEQCCDVDSAVEGGTAHDRETQNTSEAPPRAKAESESPVMCEAPLNPDIEPSAAFHSETEPRDEEGPSDSSVSRIDPKLEPEAELRSICPSDESDKSDRKNQQSPPEEIAASKFEAGPRIANSDGEHDKSSDAGKASRARSVSYIEGDGADTKVDNDSYGSERGRPMTQLKKNSEGLSMKNDERRPNNECDELENEEAVARNQHKTRGAVPLDPRLSRFVNLFDPPTPSSLTIKVTESRIQDGGMTLFHDMWHDYHDKFAPRCIEWISFRSKRANGLLGFPLLSERGVDYAASWFFYMMGVPNPNILLDKISQANRTPKFPSDLVVRLKELISDIKVMRNIMNQVAFGHPHTFRDLRTHSEGRRIIVEKPEGIFAAEVICSTGGRCPICPESGDAYPSGWESAPQP